MLLDFNKLHHKYNMKIDGVIHIGAHFGQEYEIYKKYNIRDIIFFEPLPHTFETLKKNIGNNAILVNKALGNITGQIEMYIETANQGQSSSILKPEIHLQQYPWIKFIAKVRVDIMKLDDYNFGEKKYNLINMDVQGYEMEVLKGSFETLNKIDYIICEVNRAEVYQNCAKVEELDQFLNNYGFQRVETNWEGGTWGDAFYIKNKI